MSKKRGFTNNEFLAWLHDLLGAGRTPDEALDEARYYDEWQYSANKALEEYESYDEPFDYDE